jgi:hypothetical protein
MILKRAIGAIAALCSVSLSAPALATSTPPSTLQSQVNALPWTNHLGLITGADQQALWNTDVSVFSTWGAPLDSPTFTGVVTISGSLVMPSSTTGLGTQTFGNSPCSNLTTGLFIPAYVTGFGLVYLVACAP